jgi:hypothetical protein
MLGRDSPGAGPEMTFAIVPAATFGCAFYYIVTPLSQTTPFLQRGTCVAPDGQKDSCKMGRSLMAAVVLAATAARSSVALEVCLTPITAQRPPHRSRFRTLAQCFAGGKCCITHLH